MHMDSAFAISSAGMALERARVEVAALNLANAHTTTQAGEAAFAPLRVVAHSGAGSFQHLLHQQAGSVPAALRPRFELASADLAPRMVLDPGHPMADHKGFVAYPRVDPAAEMVTIMSASRAYEANVAAMNTARAMALKALDIGGNA